MKYIMFSKIGAKTNPAYSFNQYTDLVGQHTHYEVIGSIVMNWRPYFMNTRKGGQKIVGSKFIQFLNKRVHMKLSDE